MKSKTSAAQDIRQDLADNAKLHELELLEENGEPYVGTLRGLKLAKGAGASVFLTEDGHLIVHYEDALDYFEVGNPDELLGWLSPGQYVAVLARLGLKPRVSLEPTGRPVIDVAEEYV